MNIDDVERLNKLSISDYSKALYKHKLIAGLTKAIESTDTSYKEAIRGVPKAYIREFADGKNPYLLFMKNTSKVTPTSIHAGKVLANRDENIWVDRNSQDGQQILAGRKARRTVKKPKPVSKPNRSSSAAKRFLETGSLA